MRVGRLWLRRVWRVIDQWWWKPSPIRMLMWVPIAVFADAASGLHNHKPGDRVTVGSAVAVTLVAIAVAPLVISGLRMMVNEVIVGPTRARLIRRATGRSVYFSRGRMHERRRHARLAKKASDELDRTR